MHPRGCFDVFLVDIVGDTYLLELKKEALDLIVYNIP